MAVNALYDYEYPSKDRQENFGDDQLVHVQWVGNVFLCAAACFRVPKAMPWAEFKAQMIDPWAASDPDYDPAAAGDWQVDGQPFTPDAETTVGGTGVVHKGLLSFRT